MYIHFYANIILGFESNDITIKTYVKIDKMSNQSQFGV